MCTICWLVCGSGLHWCHHVQSTTWYCCKRTVKALSSTGTKASGTWVDPNAEEHIIWLDLELCRVDNKVYFRCGYKLKAALWRWKWDGGSNLRESVGFAKFNKRIVKDNTFLCTFMSSNSNSSCDLTPVPNWMTQPNCRSRLQLHKNPVNLLPYGWSPFITSAARLSIHWLVG